MARALFWGRWLDLLTVAPNSTKEVLLEDRYAHFEVFFHGMIQFQGSMSDEREIKTIIFNNCTNF